MDYSPLAAGPCGDLTFIAGERRQPFTKESFGNAFRAACRAAGVPGSAHGVRKITATRAANSGATVAQLEAIFGWHGGAMASLYARRAPIRHLSGARMPKAVVPEIGSTCGIVRTIAPHAVPNRVAIGCRGPVNPPGLIIFIRIAVTL